VLDETRDLSKLGCPIDVIKEYHWVHARRDSGAIELCRVIRAPWQLPDGSWLIGLEGMRSAYPLGLCSIACPRCTECSDSEHHFMDNSDFGADEDDPNYQEDEFKGPTGNMYVCKHCPAVGDDCAFCLGDGEVELGTGGFVPCFDCGGDGVVVAHPRSFKDLDLGEE
jgi:hypothetical protein